MLGSKTTKLYCGDLLEPAGRLYTFKVQIMSECDPSVWKRIGQRVDTEEARCRVSRVTMMLAMFREFLMIQQQFKAQSPRHVLDQIQERRQWLERNASSFPAEPIQELFHHLNLQETALYNSLLSNPLRQAAVDAVACDEKHLYGDLQRRALDPGSIEQAVALEKTRMIATDPTHRREFLFRYLEQLRHQLSHKSVQNSLSQPFGKEFTKDREKTEGMSIKNWPIVGLFIWQIYDELLPLYRSKSRLSKSKYDGPKPELAEYPQELLKDIVELFTTEFPNVLADLTVGDVKSRIQHQLHKLREKKS